MSIPTAYRSPTELVDDKLEATAALIASVTAPDDDRRIARLGYAKTEMRIADRLVVTPAQTVPFTWLRSRLGLTETEEIVLWLLVAFELSPEIRRSVRAMSTEDVSETPIDVIRRVVYNHAADRAAWRELGPSGALTRFGLIETVGEARQALRPSARVLALAHGETAVDAVVQELGMRAPAASELVFPADARERIHATVRTDRDFVLAIGPKGMGKRSALHQAALEHGRDPLIIDARKISADAGAAARQISAIARECMLLAKTPIIVEVDRLPVDRLAVLERQLVNIPGPVLATATMAPSIESERPVATINVRRLDATEQRAIWRLSLPGASETFITTIAEAYPLSPSLTRAVGHRVMTADSPDAITTETIAEAVAAIVGDKLGPLAPRIEITQTWDDAVFEPEQKRALVELLARVQRKSKVYEQWGFGPKVGRGLGTAALFSGPPGTGKTMAAGLIAKDLGLPLHQVDLSQIESKWLGETEKNLAAVFDAAEACHAVLLFDEADGLFAKRTSVATSNDRHANQAVNYLLQRIERFTGVCILTTNHDTAIDDAFRRRLAVHLRFDTPDATQRERLWHAMLPAAAAVEHDIDFASLARRFQMAGGNIRNAVVRAAFLAADQDESIGEHHLEHAATLEYEAMGRLVCVSEAA